MIHTLTSMRFFAALMVFFSHLDYLKNFKETQWVFNRILFEGFFGVSFFFVLSGFILTYNYHQRIKSFSINMLSRFLFARFTRIYPVYLLTFLLFAIPKFILHRKEFFKDFQLVFINLGVIQSFFPNHDVHFSFNFPSWSISNEMFFYLVFPFIMIAANKVSVSSFLRIGIFLGISLFVLGVALSYIYRNEQWSYWLFYIAPPYRLIDFFIGVVMGFAFVNTKNEASGGRLLYSFLELLSLISLVVSLVYASEVHKTVRYWGYYLPSLISIIWVFSFQKGFLSEMISHKSFGYLGELSFSFYMVHMFVILAIVRLPITIDNPFFYIFLTLSISLISSHIVYKYYEIPARDYLRQKIKHSS